MAKIFPSEIIPVEIVPWQTPPSFVHYVMLPGLVATRLALDLKELHKCRSLSRGAMDLCRHPPAQPFLNKMVGAFVLAELFIREEAHSFLTLQGSLHVASGI